MPNTESGRAMNTSARQGNKQRDAAIGRVLAEARTAQRRTVAECARWSGVSRARWAEIEEGRSTISLPELERATALLEIGMGQFLETLPTAVNHREPVARAITVAPAEGQGGRVVVEAQSGDVVQLLVEVRVQQAARDEPPP